MIPVLTSVVNKKLALARAKFKVAWYRYLKARAEAKIEKWTAIEKKLKESA